MGERHQHPKNDLRLRYLLRDLRDAVEAILDIRRGFPTRYLMSIFSHLLCFSFKIHHCRKLLLPCTPFLFFLAFASMMLLHQPSFFCILLCCRSSSTSLSPQRFSSSAVGIPVSISQPRRVYHSLRIRS